MPKHAILFVVDGLSVRYLSSHGNTWIDTPHMNRLVAEGESFENAIMSDAASLPAWEKILNASLGRSDDADAQPEHFGCWDALKEAGVGRLAITDSPQYHARWAESFDESIIVEQQESDSNELPEEMDQTTLAHCFAHLLNRVPELAPPSLVVVELGSLARRWDVPLSWRARFVEEGDPEPLDLVTPPQLTFDIQTSDPDELLGWARAYAAQVELWDRCLGIFLEDLEEQGLLDQTWIGVTAPQAFPLGEHGVIGREQPVFYGEATDVPLLIRAPRSSVASARHFDLVQPHSVLLPSVCQWLLEDRDEQYALPERKQRDVIFIPAAQQRAVWTPAWKMIDFGDRQELYVRPDDRWEVNPVQDRCPQVVEQLLDLMDQCEQAHEQGLDTSEISLAPELKEGVS